MRILAIETSCDETSAAILEDFGKPLAHEILSQAATHAEFGGVVPEVASRSHLEALPFVVDRAMRFAGVGSCDLDAVAATVGPGLAAALLVGSSAAKGLALGSGKPFLGVNHLEGHLLSPFFGLSEIPPHVSLVVSGGHTLLFDVEGFGRYRLLGRTRDDAAGEAFDKVAKLLGLGYPGGVAVDRLAVGGDPARFQFPRGMKESGDFEFSFSGLKTAVRIFLESGFRKEDLPDICASFQRAVVEVLLEKAFRAAKHCGRGIVALSGGVSGNSSLCALAAVRAEELGLELRLAQESLRADNALMIAYAAAHHLAAGHFTAMGSDIAPNFDPATLCV